MKVSGTVRVAILGGAGRMGQCIARLAAQNSAIQVVARVDVRTDADGISPAIIPNLAGAPEFDVLVDFSSPAATAAALPEVRRRKCAWLVATTALPDSLRADILALGSICPVMIAANTSIGIAIMQRLAATGTARFSRRTITARRTRPRGRRSRWPTRSPT